MGFRGGLAFPDRVRWTGGCETLADCHQNRIAGKHGSAYIASHSCRNSTISTQSCARSHRCSNADTGRRSCRNPDSCSNPHGDTRFYLNTHIYSGTHPRAYAQTYRCPHARAHPHAYVHAYTYTCVNSYSKPNAYLTTNGLPRPNGYISATFPAHQGHRPGSTSSCGLCDGDLCTDLRRSGRKPH